MTTPVYKRIDTSYVTGNWQKDSELLTGVTGRFMSDTTELLNGKTLMGRNVQAEFKTVTFKTPSTDVMVPGLLNGWVAFSAAETPWIRVDAAGNIEVFGRVKTGTVATQIFAWPFGFTGPTESPLFSVRGNAAYAAIQWTPAGVFHVEGGNADVSLNTVFPSANRATVPLTCFPLSWKTALPNGKPRQVEVVQAYDVTSAIPVAVSVSPPAWGPDGTGNIVVSNILGLALNRTYAVTFRAMP